VTTFAAVLGFPIAHSRSPAMMNAALAELGLDWRYLKLPIPPERFVETVRALPASGYAGVNVTLPHKVAAFELADEPSDAVRAIGAANTLTFADDAIRADNTDAGGLLDALGEPVAGRTVLVLGAGGAGRAAVWALREAGAEVAVWNRTEAVARALAEELDVAVLAGGARPPADASPPANASRGPAPPANAPPPADASPGPAIVVNCTSVGLRSDVGIEALPLAGLEPEIVVDMVYGAEPTPVERWAAERGARVVDGLEVLVRQGARSLTIWTGREAPVDTMRSAARVQIAPSL
jgi:shikimate dehydrogenase